ncbi:MAG TPA: hypothetical protein VMH04_06690 [Candidatus Solibacter sp.]|nr:hypothetical protein [Candidatus Solibacter sp.]
MEAVDERQRLERLIERGRKEFSGYGLELFERGLRAKIAKLTPSIEAWELQQGYFSPVPHIQSLECVILGSGMVELPTVLGFSSSATINTGNVQMFQGRVQDVTLAASQMPSGNAAETSVLGAWSYKPVRNHGRVCERSLLVG